ncbi:DinB family protein [Eudoraea chungangensis]|uniref:DinB family protein n=1 Tax=Eudoraea chungangensis TaxID=1481905 RepID=UPI0023EBAF25|nr:DinB family protein [Eudoraea chungangensis]
MKSNELLKSDYHEYYGPYIEVLGTNSLNELLIKQLDNFPQFIESIADEKLHYAYTEGKWTIAEVLLHIIDAERVFQYRALRFARNDTTKLPGFDQDAYVETSMANTWSKEDIIKAYRAVRQSTISLFLSFNESQLKRKGIASNSPMSVGALGFICCGHQKHHRNVIRAKYLNT